MRRKIPLTCWLLIGIAGWPGHALAQGMAQPVAAPLPVRDTAYAMHNLFRERRFNGLRNSGYGMAGLTGTGFELAHGQTGVAVVLGLIGAMPTALGTRQYWRYSTEREAGVVRQLELGWPLPPNIRCKLRTKHFKAMPVPP